MDIARPDLVRKKKLRHSLYTVAALTVVAVITVGVSRLEPAAPQVDRDTIYLGRPVFGQEESVVSLFRVEEDGTHASRTRVSLGRASVNSIEVLEGLEPGDRVVLSDMSTWDQFYRVRID